jgi:hypothetical protein
MHSEIVLSGSILNDLQDGYVSAIYQTIFDKSSGQVSQRLKMVAEAINYDSLYLLRKLLRRFSANRFFPYDRDALLLKIFRDVIPDWQPSFNDPTLVAK